MHPLVSVILPVYNRAALLPRAVASVRAQTLADWELIVVDDGSGDGTFAVAAALAAADPRIRVLRQENAGPGAARNAGFTAARGAFITYLDSDDEYLPDHLRLRADVLRHNTDADVLHGGAVVVGGDDLVPDARDPRLLVPIGDCAVGGTFFLRRTVLERGVRWPAGFAEDAALLTELRRLARVLRVPFPTYLYHRDAADSRCSKIRRDPGGA